MKKRWAMLVYLSTNMWRGKDETLLFDEDVWNYILDEAPKAGINTIVLDVGDAIEFGSHPEIAVKGAWTRTKTREEVNRCKERGISLIPKLNFSTAHDYWLGEYARMISTPMYYRVCNDLIKEAYELFWHPEYIHIGMDEENAKCTRGQQLARYRQGELYWHDMRYLIDCVKDTGAKPWIWADPLFDHVEDYKKYIRPDEAVLSPWYYLAFREEHYTSPEIWPEYYYPYYKQEQFVQMGLKYVEEDPVFVNIRKIMVPLLEEGYQYIPCASVFNRCKYNAMDLLEHFKKNAPDNQILGYMTAPWHKTTVENKKYFEESFQSFKAAREKFYGEE